MLIPVVAAGIWINLEAHAGLSGNATALIEATQIKEMVIESRSHVLVQDEASKTMVLFPDDTSAMQRKIQAFDANAALLATLRQRVLEPRLRALVRHLVSIAEIHLAPADTELSEAAAAGDLKTASRIYRTRFLPARMDYDATVYQAAAEVDRLAAAAQAEMGRRNQASLQAIASALILGIGTAAFGLVLLFHHSLVKPLVESSGAMAAVAAGDLSRRVLHPARHEIGRFAGALNEMVDSLSGSIRGIARSSREVAAQAGELHRVSHSMEGGARHASAEAARVSEAGQAMSDSVQQSAVLLGTLASSITRVSHDTGQAAALAGEAVAISLETRRSVERLAESGDIIDSITETMGRVAFETNILALNAAIEAARQGPAGRGFAVVAKQIRAMAEQTQQSTMEISRRVAAVHSDIAAAVSGIGEIDRAIHQLASIAALIAGETRQQGDASRQLQEETGAMVASTAEISGHLADVAQVIDQTREGANQTRASADAVAASVRELDALLAHFRV